MLQLSKLTYDDLRKQPAWMVVRDYAEEADVEIEPATLDESGRVLGSLREVWCLCSAHFSDTSEHLACAMCRADSDDGPLLWSVWNEKVDVPLILPPAPSRVLLKRGPEVFAKAFGRSLAQIFPLTITVIPRFATVPEKRSIRIGITDIE